MTAPIAEVAGLLVAPDDAIHVVCCDEDLALCGSVLAGEFVPNETETSCPICAIAEAEDLPCGDPACPARTEVDL